MLAWMDARAPERGTVSGVTKKEIRDASGHAVRELHGVTLVQIVEYLVANVGWASLGAQIPVNCFTSNPSVTSSLTFLRRTPWARAKVEALYVAMRERELRHPSRD